MNQSINLRNTWIDGQIILKNSLIGFHCQCFRTVVHRNQLLRHSLLPRLPEKVPSTFRNTRKLAEWINSFCPASESVIWLSSKPPSSYSLRSGSTSGFHKLWLLNQSFLWTRKKPAKSVPVIGKKSDINHVEACTVSGLLRGTSSALTTGLQWTIRFSTPIGNTPHHCIQTRYIESNEKW